MSRLELDLLRSFAAIVDTGSFTRAADRVNKTQSSISMHIRRLEELLGCHLFEKQGRGVRLTHDGERLADFARRMLTLEGEAIKAVGKISLKGRVKLGIPDDYAESILPRVLDAALRTHPSLEVFVQCESSIVLAERVAAAEVDVALVTDYGAFAGVELLRREHLMWVAGPNGARLTPDAPIPLALGSPSCFWHQTSERVLHEAGLESRLVLASGNFAAIAPVVMAGLAITVLPPSAMRPGMKSLGRAHHLPALPAIGLGLLYAPGRRSERTLALAQALRAVVSPDKAEALAG